MTKLDEDACPSCVMSWSQHTSSMKDLCRWAACARLQALDAFIAEQNAHLEASVRLREPVTGTRVPVADPTGPYMLAIVIKEQTMHIIGVDERTRCWLAEDPIVLEHPIAKLREQFGYQHMDNTFAQRAAAFLQNAYDFENVERRANGYPLAPRIRVVT